MKKYGFQLSTPATLRKSDYDIWVLFDNTHMTNLGEIINDNRGEDADQVLEYEANNVRKLKIGQSTRIGMIDITRIKKPIKNRKNSMSRKQEKNQANAKKAMNLYHSGKADSLKEAWAMVKRKNNPRKRRNSSYKIIVTNILYDVLSNDYFDHPIAKGLVSRIREKGHPQEIVILNLSPKEYDFVKDVYEERFYMIDRSPEVLKHRSKRKNNPRPTRTQISSTLRSARRGAREKHPTETTKHTFQGYDYWITYDPFEEYYYASLNQRWKMPRSKKPIGILRYKSKDSLIKKAREIIAYNQR